ncbi:MAG: PDZ domain-containing protein [Anaerolineae bacterium]|nr:PDZ domain-containing protein [Anaerolineae bacterium]
MSIVKRTIVVGMVLTVALGGMGLAVVGAASETPAQTMVYQADGQAWLGVYVTDSDEGVMITRVQSRSPAREAGLRMGDVIVAVDDEAIESAEMLVDLIATYEPGDTIVVSVERRGDTKDYEVTLAERDDKPGQRDWEREHPLMYGVLNLMGLEASLTDDGLLVEEIDPESPLAGVGFEEGDLIVAINGELISELGPRDLMLELGPDDTIMFTVERNGEEVDIEVNLSDMDFGFSDSDWDVMPVYPFEAQIPFVGQPVQLGVQYLALTPDIAAERDLPVEEGALILEVMDDSPAAEAGLQADDIVTAVNDEPVDEEHTLRDRLVAYEENDVVTLAVLRDGEELEIEVTIGMPGFASMFMEQAGHMRDFGQHGMGFFFAPGAFDFEGFMDMHPFMGQMLKEHGPGFFNFGDGDNVEPEAVPDTDTGDVPDGSAA